MGFDQANITLLKNTRTYNVGQVIHGLIVFDLETLIDIHGIYVSCVGFCGVQWTEDTQIHSAFEKYNEKEIFIVGDLEGSLQLQPGHYEFRFAIPIPKDCPPSFEGEYGCIRYQLKAAMVMPDKVNIEKSLEVKVRSPVELLDNNPDYKEPLKLIVRKKFSGIEGARVTIKFAKLANVVGVPVPVKISINNLSNIQLDQCTFTILKKVVYLSSSSVTKSAIIPVSINQVGPIRPNKQVKKQTNFGIPNMELYNMKYCRFIKNGYFIKIHIEISGHEDTSASHPLFFYSKFEDESDDNSEITSQDQEPSVYPPMHNNSPSSVSCLYPALPSAPYLD